MKIQFYIFPSVALNFLFLKKEEEEEKCDWVACFSYSIGLFERKDMNKGIIRTTHVELTLCEALSEESRSSHTLFLITSG